MGDLVVALHGEEIGALVGSGSSFDFRASTEAIRRHGVNSTVLSLAVPLTPRPEPRRRAMRQNFFSELLPEGDARQQLARQAGIRDEDDTIALLRAYGRDVAGAIQIWDPTLPGEPRTPSVAPLDEAAVADLLRNVAAHPLGNAPQRGKSSLAGVQSKVVLVRDGDAWARAVDGFPSTHIIKPKVARHPHLIFDEEYGSRFARALGLAGFETAVRRFEDIDALIIERYDRARDRADGRIHQEDFNQVLGLRRNDKYEAYGRKGLRDVAAHLSRDDRLRLLRMTALSVAVGNLDMHLKNISLLHEADGGFTLAPMYDVVPQHFPEYENDGEVALSIAGVFDFAGVRRDHLEAEADSWGIRGADAAVADLLADVMRIAELERPHPAAHPGLGEIVRRTAENLLAGRTATGLDEAPPRRRAPAGAWEWRNATGPAAGW